MEKVKYSIIYFFFTHFFLRRIGKKYPDFFKKWMADTTDSKPQRRVMELRYTGDTPMKFEAIAIKLGISPRRVFELHKKVLDVLISG